MEHNPQELIALDGKVKEHAGERSIEYAALVKGTATDASTSGGRSANSRGRMESCGTSGGKGGWN